MRFQSETPVFNFEIPHIQKYYETSVSVPIDKDFLHLVKCFGIETFPTYLFFFLSGKSLGKLKILNEQITFRIAGVFG